MNRPDMEEVIRRMLPAYLDGELTQAEHQRVRLQLEVSDEFRRELAEMAELKRLTAGLDFGVPPDELMDALEHRVSVKAPRLLGWGMTIVALCCWLVYVTVLVLRNLRWPTLPELLGGGVVAGLLLLFLSVLRQRILERPHDRYRKVKR